MAEYIEREALIKKIDEEFYKTDTCGEEQIGFLKCRRISREIPAADVASVRPELRKAVDLLHKNYEKALNSSYVRNPIAWDLYHTWKKMDKNNRRRCQ